jgi:hypothetical protein
LGFVELIEVCKVLKHVVDLLSDLRGSGRQSVQLSGELEEAGKVVSRLFELSGTSQGALNVLFEALEDVMCVLAPHDASLLSFIFQTIKTEQFVPPSALVNSGFKFLQISLKSQNRKIKELALDFWNSYFVKLEEVEWDEEWMILVRARHEADESCFLVPEGISLRSASLTTTVKILFLFPVFFFLLFFLLYLSRVKKAV